MLEAAVERKQEPEEVAALSKLLEDGYMTKGDGQNLTAFYFEMEKE